ncbi:hypothetical protein FACS189452_04490 [Bacteroidia bacterium]|nr:hypothetical protein FACS189452_04490 [Bacteroidia bacterium]GHT81257.1 hypothetical protein FACS189467_4990 [Bacteroidia bacterium]
MVEAHSDEGVKEILYDGGEVEQLQKELFMKFKDGKVKESEVRYPFYGSVKLKAVLKDGYEFVEWRDAEGQKLSGSKTYKVKFSKKFQDVEVKAVSKLKPYKITVNPPIIENGEAIEPLTPFVNTTDGTAGKKFSIEVEGYYNNVGCYTQYEELYSVVGWIRKSKDKKDTIRTSDFFLSNVPIGDAEYTAILKVKDGFSVAAYLIYEDDTRSSFDVTKVKDGSLWNVIIGEGCAEKSSQSVVVVIAGVGKDLQVQIKNGDAVAVNKTLSVKGKEEFTITNTGCKIVDIFIVNSNGSYHNTIDFDCGE